MGNCVSQPDKHAMKTCIALLTCDKPELTRQSIVPLLDCGADILWCDGSRTEAGTSLLSNYDAKYKFTNVRGGAGAAIVFALSKMLEKDYDYVGLVENDVLLGVGWFSKAMALFEVSPVVGAISARCYEDRILFQQDGYAICHNLGAGQIVLSRAAATLILEHFRTGWTADNRRVFGKLAGVDIGGIWCFRGSEHWVTADWHWDALLAAHGYASLALTPSPCDMIGQNPPLAEQGLTIAAQEVEARRDNDKAAAYLYNLKCIREGALVSNEFTSPMPFIPAMQQHIVFPHQVVGIGGCYTGNWRLTETRGWGTFAWTSAEPTTIVVDREPNESVEDTQVQLPITGACSILVGGGAAGGHVSIRDESGFFQKIHIKSSDSGQTASIVVPPTSIRRTITLTMLDPGLTFYGVTCREPQVYLPADGWAFNHKQLAPA